MGVDINLHAVSHMYMLVWVCVGVVSQRPSGVFGE